MKAKQTEFNAKQALLDEWRRSESLMNFEVTQSDWPPQRVDFEKDKKPDEAYTNAVAKWLSSQIKDSIVIDTQYLGYRIKLIQAIDAMNQGVKPNAEDDALTLRVNR